MSQDKNGYDVRTKMIKTIKIPFVHSYFEVGGLLKYLKIYICV